MLELSSNFPPTCLASFVIQKTKLGVGWRRKFQLSVCTRVHVMFRSSAQVLSALHCAIIEPAWVKLCTGGQVCNWLSTLALHLSSLQFKLQLSPYFSAQVLIVKLTQYGQQPHQSFGNFGFQVKLK